MNTNLETPPELVRDALKRFGLPYLTSNWVDVCATKQNSKFPKYFSRRDDLFKQTFDYRLNYFMNPPFDQISKFLRYVYDQYTKTNCNVMCILPCYTDSSWWTELIGDKMQYVADYFFLDKRLGFFKNGKVITSNKYYMPCAFILWRRNYNR